MKPKLLVISSTYPYGISETFLENEMKLLVQKYDITVLPLKLKNNNRKVRPLHDNITYQSPVLTESKIYNVLKGLFNTTSILPYFIDILNFSKNETLKLNIYKWSLYLVKSRILHAYLKRNDYYKQFDALYFYWCTFPIKLLNELKSPILIRIHGGEIDKERNNNYIPLIDSRLCNQSNILYIPISSNANKLLSNYGTFEYKINRLGVFDNGLNLLNKKDNKLIHIVSCSNLIKLKRVYLIVKALQHVHGNIKWTHIGDGPMLMDIIEKSKLLKTNVECYFTGSIPNREVINFYKNTSIDLFVNVSDIEGVPVSIMEALSFGIPVFATNVGGTSEIVDDSVGKLVQKDFKITDLSQFIDNIKVYSKSKNLRLNARRRWEKLCSGHKNYSELIDIIQSIIN